jgi:CPA2 family monovalent cation:H+ antiporter-2
MNVPPIIGAFFMGMILAESKVSARVQSKLESFKDAFVAIFFTSFGMMIDPAMFSTVMWIVLLAIPIVILYEAFVMSAISYFMGFSSKASATIGTSMCGRGVESILYASVGSNVQGATMGAQLNPFAGAFCFGMSAITPGLVKHSSRIAGVMSRLVPRSLRFSGAVVSRTLGKVVIPSTVKLFKGAKVTGSLLVAFAIVCVSILLSQSLIHMVLILVGVAVMAMLYFAVRYDVTEIARHVNYANIGVATNDRRAVVNLVSGVVMGAVASALFIVSTWGYLWQMSVIAALAYAVAVALMMRWAFKVLYSEGTDSPQKVFNFPRPPRADEQADDLLPDVPMPVYNVVRAAPSQGEVRL